jgi:hypothetical protein
VAGAPTGTALNLADPTFWPRWFLMFGLALLTTAAWTAFDTVWLAEREGEEYQRWARTFAMRLAIAGAIWSTLAGSWYVLGTWSEDVRGAMFSQQSTWLTLLTLLTGASPWLVPALLWLGRNKDLTRVAAVVIALAQLVVLAVNAISRQFVQNIELGRLFQPGVSAQPVAVDWGPMVMFLVTFVAGVGVLVWMFAQLGKAAPEASP